MQYQSIAAMRQRVHVYLTADAVRLLDVLIAQHALRTPPAPPGPMLSQLKAERKALLAERKSWRYTSYGHDWTQGHPDGVRAREALAAKMKPGDLYPQAQLDAALQAWIRGDDLPPLPDGRYTKNAVGLGRPVPATHVAGDVLERLMREEIARQTTAPAMPQNHAKPAVSKR